MTDQEIFDYWENRGKGEAIQENQERPGNDTNEAREFLRGFLHLLSEDTLKAISRNLYSELDSAELGPESDRIARYVLFVERELGEIRMIRAAEYQAIYS